MNDFIRGFLHGARETPAGYFAPAVAVWRLLILTTESLLSPRDRAKG